MPRIICKFKSNGNGMFRCRYCGKELDHRHLRRTCPVLKRIIGMPQREQWEQQLFWQLCDECKFNRQGVCLAACKQNQSIEQMIADPAKWCPTYRWQQRLEYGAC